MISLSEARCSPENAAGPIPTWRDAAEARSGAVLSGSRRLLGLWLGGLVMVILILRSSVPAAAAIQDLPDDYDLSAMARSPSGKGTVRVKFGTQENGDGYTLVVSSQDLKLERGSARSAETLDKFDGVGLRDARETPMKVAVQRRRGRIFVLAGASLVMTVEDDTYSGGSADSATTEDATCTNLRVQPVEPIYFSDDFMRQPNERGEWTYDEGAWQIQTIGIAERGANPFSLESSPGPRALATAGYPFWSNYSFEAAAKGSRGTAIGICADVQDRDNYYLLRWTSGETGALELLRVVSGKATSIARLPGGFIPGLWYQIGLRTAGGTLFAEVDHQTRLSVHDATFGDGKIGLYSEGAGETVWFDSILVHPSDLVYDNFSSNSSHRWQVEDAKALGGSPEWTNYTVTAQVEQSEDLAGIPVHFRDSRNYSALVWDKHSCSLVSVVDGEHHILAGAKLSLDAGHRYTVQAGCEDGYLWGAFDGKKVVEALETRRGSGRAGLQPAAQAGRSFRSIKVQLEEKPEPTDALTAEFTQEGHHPDMSGWAGPLHAWSRANFTSGQGYWHKGNLYGDTTIRIPLADALLKNGKFAVVLNANGKREDSGYLLSYQAATPGGIKLDLSREGQPVAAGHIAAPTGDDPVALDLYRRGSFIYAGVGGNIALRYRDPQPLDNYSLPAPVGYAGDGVGHDMLGLIVRSEPSPDVPSIEVDNPNVYAETFHLAPVNWRPQSGVWQVTSRWSCQPGWTWYGGKSSGYAVNWHKSPLWGDQSIEYYTAAMMAATRDAGTESWQDFNCAFCADGVNLFSGYTLMVGGWRNSVTRLYRKGHMVAENSQFHFPPAGSAHRLWYDIHIVKQGGHIQVVASVNENPNQEQVIRLIDWTDPNPIQGGFTSFWTYDNGMVLARAVLSAQQQGQAPLYAAAPVWLAKLPGDAPYPSPSEVGLAAHDIASPDSIVAAAPSVDEDGKDAGVFHPVIHLAQGPPHPVGAGENHPAFTEPVDSGQDATAGNPNAAPGLPTGALVNPAPGMIGFGPGRHARNRPTVPFTAEGPAATSVDQAPVQLDADGMTLTVQPGGRVTDVQYHGQQVLREVVMDIRTAAWHQIKLTPENARVKVVRGAQPGVDIVFHVQQPDLNMVVSGHEAIRILPGGTLRAEASIDPGSTFQSNRISINLVIPAEGYAGHRFFATADGARRTISVPAEPLYPIQFATGIRRLWLPRTGMEIHPLGGVGVLEDLRHYNLNEFWFEQEAAYAYPQVPNGARKYVGLEASFGGAADLAQ